MVTVVGYIKWSQLTLIEAENSGSVKKSYLSSSRGSLGTRARTGTRTSGQRSGLRANGGVLGDIDSLVLGSNGTGSQGGNDSSGSDTHFDGYGWN